MSEIDIDPKPGNIADIFKLKTDKRIGDSLLLDEQTRTVFSVLQEEMFDALRLLENAIISK
ncbi:MAG: hypothetical protein HDQ97_09110 [Lachnospiraceae bacterium]|nr:hypothetical protein [Lachnospiraceae bacterium]